MTAERRPSRRSETGEQLSEAPSKGGLRGALQQEENELRAALGYVGIVNGNYKNVSIYFINH